MLEKCSDIFRDKLGTIVGMKTHINVPENSVPRQDHLHMHYKNQYHRNYSIYRTMVPLYQYSILIGQAPIVPIIKEDKTIMICGNYKVTVNQVSKLDNYPIPKTEDLLGKIGLVRNSQNWIYLMHANNYYWMMRVRNIP